MQLTANIYLHGTHVAILDSDGIGCQVALLESYKNNKTRDTLSLTIRQLTKERLELFEFPGAPLPPFIKSMLPEGVLREYLIDQSGMTINQDSFAADAYLLKAVGSDMPGAVEVRDVVTDGIKDDFNQEIVEPPRDAKLRFSLSGVQQKFSFQRRKNKFVVPVGNEAGDYLIKPQPIGDKFPNIAINEYFHMRLAGLCGLDIPDIGLQEIQKEESDALDIPEHTLCYYVKRFDRDEAGKIHMEELHQALKIDGKIEPGSKYDDFSYIEVMDFLCRYDQKYGTNLLKGYLEEFCFNCIIGNADFHLKNSAFIYPDRINPQKAPSYDILNTELYGYARFPMQLGVMDDAPVCLVDFNQEHFAQMMAEIDAPEEYGELFSQMSDKVAENYMEALEDPLMKDFCPAAFKQRLVENFQFRIQEVSTSVPGLTSK